MSDCDPLLSSSSSLRQPSCPPSPAAAPRSPRPHHVPPLEGGGKRVLPDLPSSPQPASPLSGGSSKDPGIGGFVFGAPAEADDDMMSSKAPSITLDEESGRMSMTLSSDRPEAPGESLPPVNVRSVSVDSDFSAEGDL